MLVECSALYSSLFLSKSSPGVFILWNLLQHPVSPLMLRICSDASPLRNNDGVGEGSRRWGIVSGTCPPGGRDCSPYCIWKLQSSPWIHFPSLWTIYIHMHAHRWKKNNVPLQSRRKGRNRSLLFSLFKYPWGHQSADEGISVVLSLERNIES